MERLTQDIILLDSLKNGVYEYEYELDDAYFQGIYKTEIVGGKVNAVAHLTVKEDDIKLHISVKGQVGMTCDRCLDRVDMSVEAEDDFDVEPHTKELDLCWLAYELSAVNLPLVHCHPEDGCNPQMIALLQDHLRYQAEDPEEA